MIVKEDNHIPGRLSYRWRFRRVSFRISKRPLLWRPSCSCIIVHMTCMYIRLHSGVTVSIYLVYSCKARNPVRIHSRPSSNLSVLAHVFFFFFFRFGLVRSGVVFICCALFASFVFWLLVYRIMGGATNPCGWWSWRLARPRMRCKCSCATRGSCPA